MSPEDTFSEGAFQLDLDRQENEARENIQDFYKEQIETPMRAQQFTEYMELPSFRGSQFSKGGIASLNVKK